MSLVTIANSTLNSPNNGWIKLGNNPSLSTKPNLITMRIPKEEADRFCIRGRKQRIYGSEYLSWDLSCKFHRAFCSALIAALAEKGATTQFMDHFLAEEVVINENYGFGRRIYCKVRGKARKVTLSLPRSILQADEWDEWNTRARLEDRPFDLRIALEHAVRLLLLAYDAFNESWYSQTWVGSAHAWRPEKTLTLRTTTMGYKLRCTGLATSKRAT